MTKIDADTYIKGMLSEIDRAKTKNRRSLYRMNAKMKPDIAKRVKDYFTGSPLYRIEMKLCKSCISSYDIIIYFV